MKLLSKLGVVIMAMALLNACSQAQKKSNTKSTDEKGGRTVKFVRSVSFISTDGDTVSTIEAAVADNIQERNEGLMDVRDLPSDKGMLFIFDESQPRSFWMANTPLPLDIIFVNENKEIVRIHHNTQPFSEQNFESGDPAKYVVETNGGYCIAHDIQEGMKVSF